MKTKNPETMAIAAAITIQSMAIATPLFDLVKGGNDVDMECMVEAVTKIRWYIHECKELEPFHIIFVAKYVAAHDPKTSHHLDLKS